MAQRACCGEIIPRDSGGTAQQAMSLLGRVAKGVGGVVFGKASGAACCAVCHAASLFTACRAVLQQDAWSTHREHLLLPHACCSAGDTADATEVEAEVEGLLQQVSEARLPGDRRDAMGQLRDLLQDNTWVSGWVG